MSCEGPCGPLKSVGTGRPPSDSGLCEDTTVGPTEVDLYFYQGDDEKRVIKWEDPPGTPAIDLTGATIQMQIREDNADVQPSVICEVSVGSGVTITDGPNATFEILFSASKTLLLKGNKPYLYDLSVTPLSTGLKTTILRGCVYFDLERTR